MHGLLLSIVGLILSTSVYAVDADWVKPKCDGEKTPVEKLRCPEFSVVSNLVCKPVGEYYRLFCKCGFSPKNGPSEVTSVSCPAGADDPFGLSPPVGAPNPQKCHSNEGPGNELEREFSAKNYSSQGSCQGQADRQKNINACKTLCEGELKKYNSDRPTLYCCGP